MTNKILTIGFPIYLIFFELIFRSFVSIDTSTFIGPTLAAAGLSILISLTKVVENNYSNSEKLSDDVIEELISNGYFAMKKKDNLFVNIIWIFILIGLLLWYWSCTEALVNPTMKVWFFPKHQLIGGINYLIAIIFLTAKK